MPPDSHPSFPSRPSLDSTTNERRPTPVKVFLSHDERYPVFEAATELGDGREDDIADLTDADFADYQRVCGEFYGWQRRLRALYRWDETQ